MGFGGAGRSSGARPGQGFTRGQKTAMIVAVGVALVVILLLTHRITRFEIIYFVVLIPSIILHEISHGVVALWFGDDTAKRAGRLSLNPIRHVDPVGTLLVPAVLSLSGLGAYGWAKPVPVSTNRLRSPRNQTVLVSLIGPVTNFALAAAFGVAFALTTPLAVRETVHQFGLGQYPDGSYDIPTLLGQVLFIAGFANIVLGVFNLIPCPPLDGASVLERFIPARYLPEYYRLTPVLMFLPFVLIFFFRSEWAALINHVITWWSGLLV
jgi:Zn-dependent protease